MEFITMETFSKIAIFTGFFSIIVLGTVGTCAGVAYIASKALDFVFKRMELAHTIVRWHVHGDEILKADILFYKKMLQRERTVKEVLNEKIRKQNERISLLGGGDETFRITHSGLIEEVQK